MIFLVLSTSFKRACQTMNLAGITQINHTSCSPRYNNYDNLEAINSQDPRFPLIVQLCNITGNLLFFGLPSGQMKTRSINYCALFVGYCFNAFHFPDDFKTCRRQSCLIIFVVSHQYADSCVLYTRLLFQHIPFFLMVLKPVFDRQSFFIIEVNN